MTFWVRRECGCTEAVEFRGNLALWPAREALMKRTPCTECHTKRLQERVKTAAPSLTELCFGRGEL